ncbi:40S ribosomal protein S30-B [Pichia kudriavzevii]|uniref:40S ribosomal protein S30-B n=1 Tax=Pichia kudriavzevii TaxID=4909 RepID=A0A1Z8JL61_PICKU|nr:40S ribosomal protein S30-B [Pichia kudriavzevii]
MEPAINRRLRSGSTSAHKPAFSMTPEPTGNPKTHSGSCYIVDIIVKSSRITTAGNPSRDHMSNERTALAYIRTSLNLIILALLLLQLAKYVVIAPVTQIETIQHLKDSYEKDIFNQLVSCRHTVEKFSRPISAFIFSISLSILATGTIRYIRIFQCLSNVPDIFESGLPFQLLVFLGIVIISSLAGKVKSQTPKVEKQEKPKKPKGRAYKRLLYTKRFVNAAITPGGKRKMNSNAK